MKTNIRKQSVKTIAEDTVKTLISFSGDLGKICKKLPEKSGADFENQFIQTINGIELVFEGIATVRMALKLVPSQEEVLLETDLKSILTDILEAKESGNHEYISELLQHHLADNMADWREKILPQMLSPKVNPK